MTLDAGDKIVRSWIEIGRYVPTADDCKRQPWMAQAYQDLLFRKSGGQYYRVFCGACGADDSHHPHCRIGRALSLKQ